MEVFVLTSTSQCLLFTYHRAMVNTPQDMKGRNKEANSL